MAFTTWAGFMAGGQSKSNRTSRYFTSRSEARLYALQRAMGPWRKWNIDTGRYEIELIPAADYLRMSYYEKWVARFVSLLVKTGVETRAEADGHQHDHHGEWKPEEG